MVNTSINMAEYSDAALVKQIGAFIKHQRIQLNYTQAKLADNAGLNRWTVSQIEKGNAISLTSLIQLLRALDSLQVLQEFFYSEEISPLEYAKLKKSKQRKRVRNSSTKATKKEDLGW